MMGDGVRVESHLPERRKRSTVLLVHGCCCCCCLHAVGGLAGSVYGSIGRKGPALPQDGGPVPRMTAEIVAARRFAVKTYWLALAVLFLIAAGVGALIDPKEPGVTLFVLVFFLPGGQLLASLVTLIAIQVRPPARKAESLSRLGRITLFGFLGALVGVVGLIITALTMGAM
jgi:hypothetical protein